MISITVACDECGAYSSFDHDGHYEVGDNWEDGTHCDNCGNGTFTVSHVS